ncbi:MAG: DEAD/DEAH box helicase, partial [Pseudomonadota bacterium]|nr:DEAD/DEAH box helicase [Pseudomonadota bacterium]
MADELPFFAPHLRIAVFPDWETLPYDQFSPHQDLVSERLATLWRLYRKSQGLGSANTGVAVAAAKGRAAPDPTKSVDANKEDDEGVDVVILPASTALTRLAPPSFLAATTFNFKQKARLDEAALRAQLTLAGYSHVSSVVSPGEYAVRGGLIDLFPMGSNVPYRVDLFDNEVDSIRTFDPDTQRSLYPVPQVRLLPGREFALDEPSRKAFRVRWRERIEGDPTKARLYKDMGNGIAGGGIEYYLPLFFDETATLFDYLPASATLVLHGAVDDALQRFWTDTRERHRFLKADPDRPILPPEDIFLKSEQFFDATRAHPTLSLRPPGGARAGQDGSCDSAQDDKAAGRDDKGAGRDDKGAEQDDKGAVIPRAVAESTPWARPLPDVSVERNATAPMARLQKHIDATPYRVLLVADSEGRRETLLDMLRDHAIEPISIGTLAEFEASDEKVAITAAPISEGFFWFEPDAADPRNVRTIQFITENELFATGTTPRRRRRGQEQVSNVDALIKDLSELKLGDPVVHAAHGIGRYMGLINIDLGEGPSEFLHLEYADKATLYVPVAQLALISRYTGVSAEEAPLHKLGSGQWEKARRKAAEQVRDAAAELLNLYARRAARDGYSHRFSPHDYEAFATSFGFEETPDQRAAIHAVIQDLVSPKPMDRLVCGDVGFGKTEVALRAAFVAVHGGKQVALLAPTTLLAEQHFQTISSRFGQWPVKVAEMSRFRTAKEVAAAMKGLEDGTIDIVVGTHKLLSGDVKFKRLGLLIVDEEHRFGVRHKEAMKALRAEVDVLTLTATPIPRTLGMALEGLRDLSVIATAPQRRLAIKTFVRNESLGTIREAVLRELKRGGQVYFLH